MRQVPYPTLGKLVNIEKSLHCRLPVCSGVVREKALGRFLKEGIGGRGFRGGVRSPPLRGGASPARMALRGRPGDDAKGDFLGGTRSARPHSEAVRKPRHNMIIGGKGTPGGLMGRSPGKSEVSLTGVRSPPLRGGPSPARMALRGKPRDNVEGRFLGGMRSARPQIRARRKPGYSIPTGWLHDKPVAKRTHALVKPMPSLAGVRSPPLRGGLAQHGWPSGEEPEMTRKAVFSEGRGLRARIAKPYASRGIT
jgi:hypothetical protein